MMKVKAKHWLNVNGEWHPKDDIFEVESIDGFAESVEVIAEPESVKKPKQEPEKTETAETTPKRRGRSTKA